MLGQLSVVFLNEFSNIMIDIKGAFWDLGFFNGSQNLGLQRWLLCCFPVSRPWLSVQQCWCHEAAWAAAWPPGSQNQAGPSIWHLCPILATTVQEQHRHTGPSPADRHQDVWGTRNTTCKEKLRYLGLLSLEERWLSGNPVSAFNCLTGFTGKTKPDSSESCTRKRQQSGWNKGNSERIQKKIPLWEY